MFAAGVAPGMKGTVLASTPTGVGAAAPQFGQWAASSPNGVWHLLQVAISRNYAPVRSPTMSTDKGQISEQKKSTFGRQAGRKGLQMLGICERGNFCPLAAFYPNTA